MPFPRAPFEQSYHRKDFSIDNYLHFQDKSPLYSVGNRTTSVRMKVTIIGLAILSALGLVAALPSPSVLKRVPAPLGVSGSPGQPLCMYAFNLALIPSADCSW